jgi:histone H3/H4
MTVPSASPDAILHLAALHALSAAGFASTSRAASTTLSGVLGRYLQLVGGACAERAALAGRAKVSAADVVEALEGLGVGGVEEVMEWSLDEREVVFEGGGLEELDGEFNEKRGVGLR